MRFHDFSHESVKQKSFKLETHVKCIQIRTSTALVNVKAFKFMNRQSFIAFGQCFFVTAWVLCTIHLFE